MFEEYTGEVLPFEEEEYTGEVLSLDEPDTTDFQAGTGPFAEQPLAEDQLPIMEEKPQAPTWDFEGSGLESGIPPSFQDVAGGIYNAPINMAETALAARDTLTGGDSAESFRDLGIPKYKTPERGPISKDELGLPSGEFMTGTGEVVGGGGVGYSIAKAVIKRGGKIANAVKKVFAPEAGVATGVDPETEGLLIGEDAWVWEGLGTDESGEFSEELLKKRVNLFMDAAVTVGLFEAGARGVGITAKAVKDYLITPIKNLGDTEAMGKTVVSDMLDELTTVTLKDTEETIAQKKRNITNLIEAYADEHISGGGKIKDIDYTRDTMASLEKGIDEGGLISTGGLIDESRATKARASGLKAGTQGKGGTPELEAAQAQPSLQTERAFKEAEDLAGGPEQATKTREQIQESVQGQLDPYADDVMRLEGEIIDSKEKMVDMIKNDPTFGSVVEDLGQSGAVNIDLSQVSIKTADDIVEKINTASEKMTRRKNDLFAAINEAPVNKELLNNSIAEAMPALDDNLRKGLGKASDKFKSLMDFADFQLQDAINVASKNGEYGKAKQLRELKESITKEQLDYLVTSGQQETRDAAQRAMSYYVDEYAPMFRDGRLEQIQQLGYKHRLQPRNRQAGQREIITSALSDSSKPEFSGQIIDLLEKEAGSGKLAADYVISKVADDVQRIINTEGKIPAEKLTEFANTLDKFVPVFDKVDKQQVARINDFLTRLRNKKFSTKELQGFLEEASKRKETVEKDLFSKYKEFFDEDVYTPRTSDDAIFKDVFDDPEVVSKLPGLMKGGDPEGLKAAYTKYFKDKVFRTKEGPSGELLIGNIEDTELEKLFKAGEVLYKDDPEIITAIKAITRETIQSERGRSARKMGVFDTSEFRKSASGAADFIITQIFGALSRTGARVRSGVGRVLNRVDPRDAMNIMMDKIMANPHEFVRLARQVEYDKAKKIPQKDLAPLYRFFGAEAAYAAQSEDDQTQELFQ